MQAPLLGRVGSVAGVTDRDQYPATRDPGRNKRPAIRDPEQPGPSSPARTFVNLAHARPCGPSESGLNQIIAVVMTRFVSSIAVRMMVRGFKERPHHYFGAPRSAGVTAVATFRRPTVTVRATPRPCQVPTLRLEGSEARAGGPSLGDSEGTVPPRARQLANVGSVEEPLAQQQLPAVNHEHRADPARPRRAARRRLAGEAVGDSSRTGESGPWKCVPRSMGKGDGALTGLSA